MAFVRAKTRNSKRGPQVSYQLVEAYREGGKARQRVLLHLGEYLTLDEVLEDGPAQLARYEQWLEEARTNRDELERGMRSRGWLEPWHQGGPMPEKWNKFRGQRAPRGITKYFYCRQRCRALEGHLERTRAWLAKARALKDAGVSVTVSEELLEAHNVRMEERRVARAEAAVRLAELTQQIKALRK
jgi:hypothetical protein